MERLAENGHRPNSSTRTTRRFGSGFGLPGEHKPQVVRSVP
ncbi:hypothetical protein RHOER0001_2136 [Rhodococcus erythropolis SK121]|nr:hypothetical protein RHOER0001_2136 [Rhodococcus erythropolis SK121]